MPLLWLLAGGAAAWFGICHAGKKPLLKAAVIKTASTALLALIALWSGAPGAITFGLAFGALGDWFLARPGTRSFLLGMAAFAIGHLGYVVGFWQLGLAAQPGMIALVLLGVILLLTTSTEVWLLPRTGRLVWPVRLYAIVIAAMAWVAVLLLPVPGHGFIRTGAALFLASDLILALRLFRLTDPGRKLLAARVLWPLYWLGQALILWGALA